MNKKVEEKCQELLIVTRKEGISKSALATLISKNPLKPKPKSKKDLTDKAERKFFAKGKNKKDLCDKGEDNMSRQNMVEEKLERLNEETSKVVADIQEYYRREMEKLKEDSTREILSATTDEEKERIIKRFQQKETQIKAKEINERLNVGREVLKIIMNI